MVVHQKRFCVSYVRVILEVKDEQDNMENREMLVIKDPKDLLDLLEQEGLKVHMGLQDHVELKEMLDLV